MLNKRRNRINRGGFREPSLPGSCIILARVPRPSNKWFLKDVAIPGEREKKEISKTREIEKMRVEQVEVT